LSQLCLFINILDLENPVTNPSNIAEVTGPVFAAVAACASYMSALTGRRGAQERREPMLAGAAFQTTERDPDGNAPTRLEIVNTGGPALESAYAIQAGAYMCSTLIGRGILRTEQEACVRAAMPPEENIRALWVCRGTDKKIYVCNHSRREIYPGADHAPIAEIKRYWSEFYGDDLEQYRRVACVVDLRL
jgi:hypothetical protein